MSTLKRSENGNISRKEHRLKVSDISFFREFQVAFYKNKRKIATQQNFREKSINMKNFLSESFPY
jgi:hypothetical protein